MIYLLGGPPRIGKSIISGIIGKQNGINVVSTDSIGAILENVWKPETAPDFFVKEKYEKMSSTKKDRLIQEDFAELFTYIKNESNTVWKGVLSFIRREDEERRDVLIEGVAVLPKLLNQLQGISYRAAFLGNQSKNHNENIKQASRQNMNDWMRDRTDEYIELFGLFVNRMSSYIEQESKRYSYDYIEMADRSFESIPGIIERKLFLS